MNKAYIGIDPGLSGAIALIHENRTEILSMPVAGKEIDASAINEWIRDAYDSVNPNNDRPLWYCFVVYIEAVHSMPKQGVASSFKFGFVTGVLHGVFRTLDIPLYTVTPQAWKKEILAGTDKSKQACIDWCLRAYPNVSLFRTERSRTYDDGMADALAIATYAKRKYQSTTE